MRRKLAAVILVMVAGVALGGCGSISDVLSTVMADNLPAWAGGLPANAPPRPGDPKYEEFMRAEMAKRLDADTVLPAAKPAPEPPPPAQPSPPVVAAADPPANKPPAAKPPARMPTGAGAVRAAAGDDTLNIHSIY